jgi:acyl carrier protein
MAIGPPHLYHPTDARCRIMLQHRVLPYRIKDKRLDDTSIYERLTRIFRELFEDPKIVLKPETSEADIAGWDSFANASLVAAIEKEFAIRFRTAELQTLRNVGDFVNTIRAKLQGRG